MAKCRPETVNKVLTRDGEHPAQLRIGPGSTRNVSASAFASMPICLKSCLKIFLACLLLSDVGCLTACQQLLSIWVSIEINVSRLRLCDGSRLTRCVSFSLRIVYLLKHKYKYKYKMNTNTNINTDQGSSNVFLSRFASSIC